MLRLSVFALLILTAVPSTAAARVTHGTPERSCVKADVANRLFQNVYEVSWQPMGAEAAVDYLAFNATYSVIGRFQPATSLDEVRSRMAVLLHKTTAKTPSHFEVIAHPYSINPHQCFIATGSAGSPYNLEPGDPILSNGGMLSGSAIYHPIPGGI